MKDYMQMIKKREVLRRTPDFFQKQLNRRWYNLGERKTRREIGVRRNQGFNIEYIRFEILVK